jgi:hypothetical protein
MKMVFRLFTALSTIGGLMACSLQRANQDNFLVDASNIGGAALARELSTGLKTSLSTTERALPDSDRAKIFWLDGQDFMLVLTPLPDDRCNPKASFHSTYKEQMFRLDLVYESSSPTASEKVKESLLGLAAKLRIPIMKFTEC